MVASGAGALSDTPRVAPPDRVDWIGHATTAIELDGVRFLTDPLLTKRVAHLRRRTSVPGADVGDIDAILLSHVHLDHLHAASLRLLDKSAVVVAPRGAGRLVRRLGFRTVTEISPGERTAVRGVVIDAVPAVHQHGRGPHSRIRAEPVGYVLTGTQHRAYFPGDTDLFDAMADLGDIDVALLPIWGWGPTLGPGHLDPERAAAATELIEPRLVVPIHWGTYAPENVRRLPGKWFDRPIDRFTKALDERDRLDRLRALSPGESVAVLAP